ncbi:flagellar filament capping protein FliD [Georgenia sp. SYP-B2076]|uniref:flagellar filament capping protein FliD n=1 Tax=Georgenia sp. SYP-B2076 TaxID=2495881 RepID=UPI000F8C8ABF|nr:flagellar filament capping protein FliD [Georgenia sp. SYP-B2076]
MSSIGIDGLVSGLDTTALINNLMQIESAPQTLLKNKSANASILVTALQALNTKVASLATNAAKATKVESWDGHKVASSSTAVTARVSAGATVSTLEFSVDNLAKGQVAMVDLAQAGTPPVLTVVRGGVVKTLEAKGNSAPEMAELINKAAELGISAVAVRVGNAVGGAEPEYRLQLSGVTGEANAFEVYAGMGTAGARLVDSAATTGATKPLVKAADAKITLWPTSGAAIPLTLSSATNTFADVLPGVTVSVAAKTPADAPAVLTVTPDNDSMRKLVSDVVGSVSVVLSEITSRTAATTSTGSDGRSVVSGGLFSGDSAIRFLADSVRSAASMPVSGRSPSEIGIMLDRSGAITFDQAAFDKAMAADPDGTQQMAMAIAQRVADLAKSSSDSIDGTLTLKIKSQEGMVSDLGKQIEEWDRRLAQRREGLQRTYSALEVTLSGLQSQSNWLTSQLAGLPTWNSNK